MQIRFLLPAGPHSPSIDALITALRGAGHDARPMEVSIAADSVWRAQPASAYCLIDLALLPGLGGEGVAPSSPALVLAWDSAAPPQDSALREALCAARPGGNLRVVVGSQAMEAALVALTGSESCVAELIAPGSDVMPRSLPEPGAVCTILADGTACPAPDHSLLLRALARLPDLPWQLVVVADAEAASAGTALWVEADRLGIGARVRVLPAGHQQAASAWLHADMFALAAGWLPVAAPLLPALRRGLPVIVCAGGAAEEAVPSACGAVVAAGDGVTFSKALRRVICDADLRRKLADASWQHAQTLPDWPTQAARLVARLQRNAEA